MHRYELLNGRVVANPPAGYPHGSVAADLGVLVGGFVRDRQLGRCFDSSQGFQLPSGDIVEPDYSYGSLERWAAMGAPEEGKFLPVVPDLLVEVLSSTTASRDRGEKKAIYERNGVRECWLVDPRARELVVFRLKDGRFDLGRPVPEGRELRSSVLDGLSIDVGTVLP